MSGLQRPLTSEVISYSQGWRRQPWRRMRKRRKRRQSRGSDTHSHINTLFNLLPSAGRESYISPDFRSGIHLHHCRGGRRKRREREEGEREMAGGVKIRRCWRKRRRKRKIRQYYDQSTICCIHYTHYICGRGGSVFIHKVLCVCFAYVSICDYIFFPSNLLCKNDHKVASTRR